MDKNETKIKVGDKIITYEGKAGKVTRICACEKCKKRKFFEPFVEYEDGSGEYITAFDKEKNFHRYYLIGNKVLGNKTEEFYLENHIKNIDEAVELLKKEKAQLRKQLWRLKEEMVEDWRERKALRELQKLNRENQPKENTED